MDICLTLDSVHKQYERHVIDTVIDTARSFNVCALWLIGFPKIGSADDLTIHYINSVNDLPVQREKVFFESEATLKRANQAQQRGGTWHALGLTRVDLQAILVFGSDSGADQFFLDNVHQQWFAIETPDRHSLWSYMAMGIALYEAHRYGELVDYPKKIS